MLHQDYLRGELDAQDSEGQWLIRAEFYTSSDTYLGYADAIGGPPGTTSASWIQKAGYVSAPAGAAKMRVYLLNYLNSGWMAFDDVSVKQVVSTKNYYYANGQRVAVRVKDDTNWAGNVYYLLTDHLGSTSLTVNASGSKVAELRYKPWGETRYASGTTPTSYRYTGQRDTGLGLYDYGARTYDPLLGRWIQPDSIVPEAAQGVQAWDRYAYVNNNPVRYNDPTGNMVDDGCRTENCSAVDGEEYRDYVYNVLHNENERIDNTKKVETAGNIFKLGISILWESADWALTATDCLGGECSPLVLLGLLPLIPGSEADDVADALVTVNKKAGDAFRDEIADMFREANYVVETEVINPSCYLEE